MLGELFDSKAEFSISEHYRPHWSQAGAIVFITFRTADSIPKKVLVGWDREKNDWMARNGFASDRSWSEMMPQLNTIQRKNFTKQFERCRESFLDTCHGRCLLKQFELSRIVADSLLYFDGDRYRMGDFIVMPNHVHLLAAFPSEEMMARQCDSWMHYTAFKIHKRLGLKGKFWQQEPFDHLVRSTSQYNYLRMYVADNGRKASLPPDAYLYRKYEG